MIQFLDSLEESIIPSLYRNPWPFCYYTWGYFQSTHVIIKLILMFIKLQGLDIILNRQVRFIYSFFPYVLFEHLLSVRHHVKH